MLYCNGHSRYSAGSKYDPETFNGTFNASTIDALNLFQIDVELTERNQVGLDEWMALLVSTGNPNRSGTACDCATRLTAETAAELFAQGYRYVGRYLTGDVVINNTRVAKNLLRPEMKAIFETGVDSTNLNLFVIFQDPRQFFVENPGEETIFNYFTSDRGYQDAEKAFSAAKSLGVKRNEIIYFAVDYDFMEDEVYSKIIPYFSAINAYAETVDNIFRIGIYASRNTCILVKDAGYSESSFVADLSTGYSGNMGFPLPDDWAFDQIQEREPDSDISISFDKNIHHANQYSGFNGFEEVHDDEWDYISQNGDALVNLNGVALPLFWAKVQNPGGSFSAKYPMYDSIANLAFFSYRNGVNVTTDKIRYVYFRDVGGRINAGYIDTTGLTGNWPFYMCEVYRDQELDESTIGPSTPASESFLVTRPLDYISYTGDWSVLPPGARVIIDSGSSTGQEYPFLIFAPYVKDEGTSSWVSFNAFVNLDFENGVLPNDRTLITEYVGD
jgi:peptidoglycan hydrolase-like protein with peptidoglycan-binding domain